MGIEQLHLKHKRIVLGDRKVTPTCFENMEAPRSDTWPYIGPHRPNQAPPRISLFLFRIGRRKWLPERHTPSN